MKRRGVKESDPYDWEKLDSALPVTTTATVANSQSNNPMQIKHEYFQGNNTQMTVAVSNASGTEYVSKWYGSSNYHYSIYTIF